MIPYLSNSDLSYTAAFLHFLSIRRVHSLRLPYLLSPGSLPPSSQLYSPLGSHSCRYFSRMLTFSHTSSAQHLLPQSHISTIDHKKTYHIAIYLVLEPGSFSFMKITQPTSLKPLYWPTTACRLCFHFQTDSNKSRDCPLASLPLSRACRIR